jgi:hypothetical protein
MEYRYHCQYQAESFAKQILPVPEDYPLRDGLPEDFRTHFARLCELAKDIYIDMAKQPETYGLMLIEIESQDNNLIRKAENTIHRLVDTLCRLSGCGEVQNHQLVVSAPAFKDVIKKGQGAVSNPVPKYELILSRLVDFGFVISDFDGRPFGKTIEAFTVEYPDTPEIIDTVKAYCDCWYMIRADRSSVKIWPEEFHHHLYRFDYKITADHDKIPVQQWIADEAKYYGYPDEIGDFYIAFYEYSLQYKGVKFNGDYNYKSKRIARDLQKGQGKCSLSLKLKNVDNYMSEINAMPESIKKQFAKSCCAHCGFQGATEEYCKFRLCWTFDNTPHEGCAFMCFEFDDFDLARVPDYWRLPELEYGLKKTER